MRRLDGFVFRLDSDVTEIAFDCRDRYFCVGQILIAHENPFGPERPGILPTTGRFCISTPVKAAPSPSRMRSRRSQDRPPRGRSRSP